MKTKSMKALLLVSILLMLLYACRKDRSVIYIFPTETKSYKLDDNNFWLQSAPKTQKYFLDATYGGNISGIKGCNFYFAPDALLDVNNLPVAGMVDIELREYMTKSDMLFSGVTVTSGSQLLESGGMFYLMAKQNGKELHLKDFSGFTIKIPQTTENDEPMDIYTGKANTNDPLNKINWVLKDTAELRARQDSGSMVKNYMKKFDYFKFGYTNIDREWCNIKVAVDEFKIQVPKDCNDTNCTAIILFKKYNCCAWCNWMYSEQAITTHYKLPVGDIAKILVYKKTGEKQDDLAYDFQEFTFSSKTHLTVNSMQPCTFSELENLIKGL